MVPFEFTSTDIDISRFIDVCFPQISAVVCGCSRLVPPPGPRTVRKADLFPGAAADTDQYWTQPRRLPSVLVGHIISLTCV